MVGSLPKYLEDLEVDSWVVMPKYQRPWFDQHEMETVFEGRAPLGDSEFSYRIEREKDEVLGFPLYAVDIPGRFDRPGIYTDPQSGYSYWDELERFISFQIAALDWIKQMSDKPDVVHCHDHHAGLVPFMMTRCFRYQSQLQSIPTVVTVHNGQYHGEHDLDHYGLLPAFNLEHLGLLDWDGKLNSLAAGVKCAWRVSTVSESYMEELQYQSNGLEMLFAHEKQKSLGIVNGIDVEVWDPSTDPLIANHYETSTVKKGKSANKEILCEEFGLDPSRPLIAFIGRLVGEKGADLLPDLFSHFLKEKRPVSFVVLGTGDPELHRRFRELQNEYVGFFDASLEYNEQLAHQIYAGADFMLMPSRVEPCGLNQLYAMRYGTVPVVRSVGGLKDTVVDLKEKGGYGIRFDSFTLEAAVQAVERATALHADSKHLARVQNKIMSLDFSWKRSAKEYIKMYKDITRRT